MRVLVLTSLAVLVGGAPGSAAQPLRNPFFAMDTCTKRPYPKNDITPAQQLDLLKELGYAGIAWTEESPAEVSAAVREAESRGLKMYAIYCGASVNAAGELKTSPFLASIVEALRGHGTLIWLHIGGKGPLIQAVSAQTPAIRQLRDLALAAERQGLKVAIYPHIGDWTERFEDAVKVARLVDNQSFGVTFNLCHTLAAGDEKRIPALLAGAGPALFAVTINGADADVQGPQWKRLIQTLDRGSFSVRDVLETLNRLGYQGPIGLQGYGLEGDRRDNLARSIAAWRNLSGNN
jgi:sugar phosphate isomerase/epimerase